MRLEDTEMLEEESMVASWRKNHALMRSERNSQGFHQLAQTIIKKEDTGSTELVRIQKSMAAINNDTADDHYKPSQ